MEKYGYNLVVDMEKTNKIEEIQKIGNTLGVECHSCGDFYCYDKTAVDQFLSEIKDKKLAERIFVYEGKESEDYAWKLIHTLEIEN